MKIFRSMLTCDDSEALALDLDLLLGGIVGELQGAIAIYELEDNETFWCVSGSDFTPERATTLWVKWANEGGLEAEEREYIPDPKPIDWRFLTARGG